MGKTSTFNLACKTGVLVMLLCAGLSACNAEGFGGTTSEALTQQVTPATVITLPTTEQPTGHPCPEHTIYPVLTWSPDGSKLAYGTGASRGYSEGDVFTIDVVTGSQFHLADYDSGGYPDIWSPDGRQILLNGIDTIRAINTDGTNLKDILHVDSSGLSWSPDGKQLAFTVRNELSILDLSSDTSTLLYAAPLSAAELRFPYWSPDGKHIAFMKTIDVSQAVLMVINADGTQPMQLADRLLSSQYVYWSPNNQQLAFSNAMYGPSGGAYVVNIDGTGLIKLTDYPSYNAAWLPDGTGLVVVIDTGHPPDLEFYLSQIDLDGTATILSEYWAWTNTAFSPDAAKVAFQSDEEGFDDVYVMNVDGTNKTRLTINPGFSTCYD